MEGSKVVSKQAWLEARRQLLAREKEFTRLRDAFFKDDSGAVFHTCSCYARGLDMLNAAYRYLDLVPKGRDEAGLPHPMAWVRLHDQYGTQSGGGGGQP